MAVRHEKNGRIVTCFFFISVLLGSCISPDAFGEKPAILLQQDDRDARQQPRPDVQSPALHSPDSDLPPPATSPKLSTDLSKRNTPAESEHLKQSFPQDSITFALLQKMTERHYWIGRNKPAHTLNSILQRKTNKPT